MEHRDLSIGQKLSCGDVEIAPLTVIPDVSNRESSVYLSSRTKETNTLDHSMKNVEDDRLDRRPHFHLL